MKLILLVVVASLAVLAGVFMLWARRLPEVLHARAQAEVPAPTDEVYARVADIARYGDWMPKVGTVEGRTRPDGTAEFVETRADRQMSLRIVEAHPPRALTLVLHDSTGDYSATWRYRFEPSGEGTEVTVEEEARWGPPLMRALVRLGGAEANVRQVLEGLRDKTDKTEAR